MPFKKLDDELSSKRISRVLLIGGPNTLKTTSIVRTFRKPLHIMSYPGEKGSGVIPTNDPEIHGYVWEEETESGDAKGLPKNSLDTTIKQIETTTWEILSGKHGPITTFAGDGLHKLASHYWNREYQRLQLLYETQIAQGATDREGQPYAESIKIKAYGNENFGACREILAYIARVCQSNVDTVVFTCWEGIEAEDKEMSNSQGRHIFADLPGKLARKITGEIGVCLYCEVGLPDPRGNIKGTWQIRKAGKVWGVGVKVPYDIAIKLPEKVPMDWGQLHPMLLGLVEPPAPKVPAQPKPQGGSK